MNGLNLNDAAADEVPVGCAGARWSHELRSRRGNEAETAPLHKTRLVTSAATTRRFIKLGPLFALLVALVLALSGLGCSSKTKASTASAQESAPRWSWEFYPLVSRMRLATVSCLLLPKASISIHSPLVGVLRVYADQPQTNLQAGFVWAEFEPNIFAAESAALEEARLKLEERERLQLELELPKQKLKLEREFEEAQRQFTILNLFATNQDLAHTALAIPGQSNPLKPAAVEKAKLELGLLQLSLDYLNATNLAVLGIDLPGQRSEWQRRKVEFERRQSQARLKMPFNGQLTVGLPLTDGVEEYPVNLGQELAVARDLSLIRVRFSLSNPAWVALPKDQLFIIVHMPNGEDLQAEFASQTIEHVQMREESVYYFKFPPEKAAAAARLIGTDVACELWLNLPQPAHIVPKLTLVLNQPGAFQGRNWSHGVRIAWPGAQVLVEGQTDLAIVLPTLAKK